MDMTTNQNISKEFRKRLDMINRWKKKQNPNVTVWTTVKNSEGKESYKYERKPANEAWGKPESFFMK